MCGSFSLIEIRLPSDMIITMFMNKCTNKPLAYHTLNDIDTIATSRTPLFSTCQHHLGVAVTNKNFMHREIKTKINLTNAADVCSISLPLNAGRHGHPLGLGHRVL